MELGTVLSLIALITSNVILIMLLFTRIAREVTEVKTDVKHIHSWVEEISTDLKQHLIKG